LAAIARDYAPAVYGTDWRILAHAADAAHAVPIENAMNAWRRGAPVGQIAASFFGVTPAGYKAEHSAEQQRQAESGRTSALRPLQKKLRTR
jgi:hypothetical protein